MSDLTYLNFDVQIEHAGDAYRLMVESPGGESIRTTFESPFSDLELENFLLKAGPSRRGVRRIDSSEVEAAKLFGQRMFAAVFSDDVRAALQNSLEDARQKSDAGSGRVGVRIRLRLMGAPELANLPWEYVYNSSLNRFLALSVDTPIVRYLELPERIRPIKIAPPVRILVMIAGPRDFPRLDIEEEWSKLQSALADLLQAGMVELDLLETPTLPALQRRLRTGTYHIWHFIGHGGYDRFAQDGLLVLEDEDQRGRPVSGQDLGMLLHDHTSLRLAILNSCEGARTGNDDPFAGVAQSLVQQGIPAVIAMQFEITDAAAITFAHEFYRSVADGYPVDASLTEARKVMFANARGNGLEWGTPVLYMRSPDGRIFDLQKRALADRVPPPAPPEQASIQAAPVGEPAPILVGPAAEGVAPISAVTVTPNEPAPATLRGEQPPSESIKLHTEPVPNPTASITAAPRPKPRSLLPFAVGGLVVLLLAAVLLWQFTSGSTGVRTSSGGNPSETATNYVLEGKQAVRDGDYVKAIQQFGQAIELQPDYAEAYLLRGMAYLQIGYDDYYHDAMADFDKAIALKPNYAEAHFEKGVLLNQLGESDQAIEEFTKAIANKSDYADALEIRGLGYFNRREYDAAFADLNATIELNPDSSRAYLYRGRIYHLRADYNNAISDFTSAVNSYKEYAEAYLARGDAYVALEQRELAINDFKKVLELTQQQDLRQHAQEQLAALGNN